MSEYNCQLCSKGDVDFIARCGHRFHENCISKEDRYRFQCKECFIKLFKSKIIENILFKAREQKVEKYNELTGFFTEINGYPDKKGEVFIEINNELLRLAINLGLDLGSINSVVMVLLIYICEHDLPHKLVILMDLGLKVKPDEDIGKEIWSLALKNEAFGILEMMKEFGFDPKSVDPSFATKFRVTRWLFENGFELNQKIGECYHIHLACDKTDINLIKFLLRNGADINCKDGKGFSPLHRFVDQADITNTYFYQYTKEKDFFLEELIRLGSDIESVDNENSTPLYTALKKRKTFLVKFLMSKNANTNTAKIKELGSILLYVLSYHAKVYPNWDLCQFLSVYPNINEKDAKGQTCMHKIMSNEYNEKYVEIFVDNYADVNAQDIDGNTPMHILSSVSREYRRTCKIQLLIKNGGNIHLKNRSGEGAFISFFKDKKEYNKKAKNE